ncbi:hypothetical protein MNR01_08195 [Lysobacter sp. S4-A87]|uniref:hypothetical protein n=1 Tax=Lysobacter sp. S4-A87 TaxID=2925843 RepID=UPI001F53AE76|nr:hypothetical protein [Lysobacter sp. S4-A87]UNK50961.1 hypothetical protein MNR01_08195 [Lysobacter sp. S4-A87]
MKQYLSRGPLMAALMLLALTGCVSMPKQQAYNRESHTNIKTIAVLGTTQARPTVFMLNHPGASFGLIGGLIAASDQASKQKKFDAIVAETGFEPLGYFKEQLTTRMSERGYTLVWPQAQVETAKVERGSFGLRKAYTAAQGADAQLDINFGFVGYAAAGATDDSPYRPTVTVGARLVSADGQQNYFTDFFAYNNVFNLGNAVAVNANADYAYPDFDNLHAAGPKTVEGLKTAIDAIAAEVARQL